MLSKKIFSFLLALLFTSNISYSQVPIGMNSSGLSYYTDDFPLKNLVSKIGAWGAYNDTLGQRALFEQDRDGYPIPGSYNNGVRYYANVGNGSRMYTGDYVILYEGGLWPDNTTRAEFSFTGPVSNVDIKPNRITLTLTQPTSFAMHVTKNPVENYVRNFVIVEKRFESNYQADPVHPDYAKYVSKFHTFRFMDLSGASLTKFSFGANAVGVGSNFLVLPETVNSSVGTIPVSTVNDAYVDMNMWVEGRGQWPIRMVTGYDAATRRLYVSPPFPDNVVPSNASFGVNDYGPVEWSERTLPTEIEQGSWKGMAIEHQVAIANAANVNPWFCMPTKASDDYIRQMAIYVKNNLNPNLKIYLEYSNEAWNPSYPGYQRSVAKALAMGYPYGESYQGLRSCQIFRIWSEVFGEPVLRSQRTNSRLVRAINVQMRSEGRMEYMFNFKDWPAGDPLGSLPGGPHKVADFMDAVACAPYFDMYFKEALTKGMTEYYQDVKKSIDDVIHDWATVNYRQAELHGLKLVAYEGGPGGNDWLASNFDMERNRLGPLLQKFRSPMLRSLYCYFFEEWEKLGPRADVFIAFNLFGGISKYGWWGHLTNQVEGENSSDGLNQKWLGMMDYMNGRQTPVAPYKLTANATGNRKVQLVWADNSIDETAFVIERRVSSGAAFTELVRVEANQQQYEDTSALPGVEYTYRVKAINNAGASELSNEATATTPVLDVVLSVAPQNLAAMPYSPRTMKLTWELFHGPVEDSIVIERKEVGKTDYVVIARLPAGSISFLDSGLTHNAVYSYRARTVRDGLFSGYSDEATTRLEFAEWTVDGRTPSNLKAVLEGAVVNLTWEDRSGDEDGFVIERKTNATPYVKIGDLEKNSTSFIDNDVSGEGVYTYRIGYKNTAGNVIYGADETQISILNSITPAPVINSNIKYSFSSQTRIYLTNLPLIDLEVKIYNANNTAVYTKRISRKEKLNISKVLPNGTYRVVVEDINNAIRIMIRDFEFTVENKSRKGL